MIQKHALGNPESAIRVALGETADLRQFFSEALVLSLAH
jgi:hypothetical protein